MSKAEQQLHLMRPSVEAGEASVRPRGRHSNESVSIYENGRYVLSLLLTRGLMTVAAVF